MMIRYDVLKQNSRPLKHKIYPIKGTFYYQDIKMIAPQLMPLQPLYLVAEKTNFFDEHAIQIWAEIEGSSQLLGYIPRRKTSFCHYLLTSHAITACQLILPNNINKIVPSGGALSINIQFKNKPMQLIRYYWWLFSITIWRT